MAEWRNGAVLKRLQGTLATGKQRFGSALTWIAVHVLVDPRRWLGSAFSSTRTYLTESGTSHKILIGFILFFGGAIAAGGYASLQNYSAEQAQKEFQGPAEEVATFLTGAIERHISLLSELQRKFTAGKEPPSRWTFFNFAEKAMSDHPGMQAMAWVPRVPADRRPEYEKRAVKDGLYKFRFLGPEGRATAVKGDGAVHFPIYYIEPFAGNDRALGYDLATDAVALNELRRARDLGSPVAGNMTVVEGGDNQKNGIIVTIPVYRSETLPFTVEERRKELVGFIRGVIRFDKLIQAYRSNMVMASGVRVYLYSHDTPGTPRLRFHSHTRDDSAAPAEIPGPNETGGVHVERKFNIADQQWMMVLGPESNWLADLVSGSATAFATFTLLLTALLLLYLVTTRVRTLAIEQSVAERTASLRSEIVQRMQVEKELRSAKEEAESANQAKSEFLAVMSHELRTPLNAVIGFAEMMSNELYGKLGHENYRQYSSFIRDSAEHLLSLINDILDLSKIEADRYELRKEVVSVADVWGAVNDMLGERLAMAGLTLECALDETPVHIRADARALRQILLNLLSNAIKFTPKGGSIAVTEEIDAQGNYVLKVRDTGVGISDDDLATIFEPFRQLDSSVARNQEGTGLGLPLTQRLIELHGARLEIESELDAGTCVSVIFTPDSIVPGAAPPANGAKRKTRSRAAKPAAPKAQAKKRQSAPRKRKPQSADAGAQQKRSANALH